MRQCWLTTAERTANGETPAPLKVGPMLVLTGSNDRQQIAYHDHVPVGQRLRLFGSHSALSTQHFELCTAKCPFLGRPDPTARTGPARAPAQLAA